MFSSVAISYKFLDKHIMCVAACMFAGYRHWLFFVLFVVFHDCIGNLIGSLRLSLHGSLSFMNMCTTHYFLIHLLEYLV